MKSVLSIYFTYSNYSSVTNQAQELAAMAIDNLKEIYHEKEKSKTDKSV